MIKTGPTGCRPRRICRIDRSTAAIISRHEWAAVAHIWQRLDRLFGSICAYLRASRSSDLNCVLESLGYDLRK